MKYDPAVVSLGMFGASIALYMAAISPMLSSLAKARNDLIDDTSRLNSIEMDVRMHDELKRRIADLDQQMTLNRGEWISPMLDSYSMRAKSFVGAMAKESGLINVEYSEGKFWALPVPRLRVPETRTGRRSVNIKALGDYAAIASFILRMEAELPMMTLQSVKIVPSKTSNAERQEVNIVMEWPCEGEEIK